MNIQDKQGYLGDWTSKSTMELLDLLQRQENILSKKKFVQSLPDKGRKVIDFAEKLRAIIRSRDPSLLKSANSSASDGNGIMNVGSEIDQCESKIVQNTQGTNAAHISMKHEEYNMSGKSVTEIAQTYVNKTDVKIPVSCKKDIDIKPENSENDIDTQADLDSRATTLDSRPTTLINQVQSLESEFTKMEIGGMDNEISERLNQEKSTHSYRKAMTLSVQVPEHFKTNRSLKIKEIKDLPQKYKPPAELAKLKPAIQVIRNFNDGDSAATPPVYKNPCSRLISLDESVHLQKMQKKKQEELQAKCAAEKLAQRLQITMETYNPEGVDMSYRNTEQDIDSDDDLE